MEKIIADSRVNQLLARFEPWQQGLVYHHDASTGGLPCTHEELESLLAEFVAIHHRIQRAMTAWVIVAAIVLAALSVGGWLALARWQQALVFLAPFPLAIQQFWLAHRLPWQRLGRRMPMTPSRSRVSGFWSRTAALPLSLVMAMLLVACALAFQVFKDGWQARDAGFLPFIVVPVVFAGFIAFAKVRRRR